MINNIPRLYRIVGGKQYGIISADFFPNQREELRKQINEAIEDRDYNSSKEIIDDYRNNLYSVWFPIDDNFISLQFISGKAAIKFIKDCNDGLLPEFTDKDWKKC